MSSGQTHDKVTLALAPFILVGAWYFVGWLALIVLGTFLFAGFAFNGDLDLKSQVYYRWFFMRWIWIPYQMYFTHRCIWTHGPILGTAIRVSWIALWFGVVGAMCGILPLIVPFLISYKIQFLLGLIGLELGSLSHTFMDWSSTGFKKLFN